MNRYEVTVSVKALLVVEAENHYDAIDQAKKEVLELTKALQAAGNIEIANGSAREV